MDEWLIRTNLLLKPQGVDRLRSARLLVVGVGGVGGYAAEMLARAGVGHITLIDSDEVAPSNINRQLIALHSTVGKPKVEVLEARLKDINPQLEVDARQTFIEPEAVADLLAEGFDYVVDAIDTLTPKIALIEQALRTKCKIISSMGAGARLDPSAIRYGDISQTTHCALAKAVRHGLRARGIRKGLKVVFSTEQPMRDAVVAADGERYKKTTVGTVSFMPAIFGCYLAAFVIRKLTEA